MTQYKRLQGAKWQRMKDKLTPVGYAETRNGNICVYYDGDYTHYLSDVEKEDFDKNSLPKITPNYGTSKPVTQPAKTNPATPVAQPAPKDVINQYCEDAVAIAHSKGWHDDPKETGTMLALIHSEVSEALEADRIGDDENFAEELADVVIRVFDLCGFMNIDLGTEIDKKMAKNRLRPHMHGGKNY